MSDDHVDSFALGLYAGEGAKTPGAVSMANTNPLILRLFVDWLRRNFEIEDGSPASAALSSRGP